MKDLHDTTVIPWSIQLTDIINAVRTTGDTLISIGTKDHGERVVTITRAEWSYSFEERYAGGGLASIRMYKYVEDHTLMPSAPDQGTPRGDSASWAQVLSTGTLTANGYSTCSSADGAETTMASMSLQNVASRRLARRLIVVSIDHRPHASMQLGGTQWKVDVRLDNPRLASSFIIGFDRTELYVTAPCSDCHTTTWQYHLRSADSIQIWARASTCPALCMSKGLPQSVMDVLGSTWGVIDDDTITFEGNGNEVVLRRVDP